MWPFGKSKPARFVEPSAFDRNLAIQMTMAQQTVVQLHEAGMKPGARLRLEYFFYAASRANGEGLARALVDKGYSSECRPAADGSSLFCITGWSVPFAIDQGTAVAWTNDMCGLGYDHDCEFDGWGTNPHQPEFQN